MPTLDERRAQHGLLIQALTRLETFKPDELTRTELPEEVSFRQAAPYIEETWRLYRDVSRLSLERASYSMLTQLNGAANSTLSLFDQIRAFVPGQHGPNAVAQRDSIYQQLRDGFENVFEQTMKARAFLTASTVDPQSLEIDAQRVLTRIDSLYADQQQSLTEKVAAAEAALETVRNAAAEAGVSQNAVYFREEAQQHQRAAKVWLGATILLTAITVGFGVASYFYQSSVALNPAAWQVVQLTLAKVIIFSILATSVIWAGKVYRAHRHNYVLNRHRQNALSTFQTFSAAASDPDIKNAVLLQATQSIFAVQDTGFSARDSDVSPSPQILEIVRGATRAQ